MTKTIAARKTAADLCDTRDQIVELVKQANALMTKARRLAAIDVPNGLMFDTPTLRRIGKDSFVDDAIHTIDAAFWTAVFKRTGVGDFLDTEARSTLRKQLQESPPPLEIETVVSTMLTLAADAPDRFTRTVETLFNALRPRFKTHKAHKFTEKMIFESLYCGYGSSYFHDTFWDLELAAYTVVNRPPPERYGGLVGMVRSNDTWCTFDKTAGTDENEMFRIKWFKNGNVHVFIKDPKVVDGLNAVLADSTSLGRESR